MTDRETERQTAKLVDRQAIKTPKITFLPLIKSVVWMLGFKNEKFLIAENFGSFFQTKKEINQTIITTV